MSFRQTNPNPLNKNTGDCTIRAIAIAEDMSWDEAFIRLCIQSLLMADMPSSNDVWGTYLAERGYKYHLVSDAFPFGYTVRDFCHDHPTGTHVLGTGTHVVCARNGDYMDAWDSGDKTPIYYFTKEN